MKKYFTLQFKMCNRQLTEWGVEPILGYTLGLFIFSILSFQLFKKTQYADVIYIAIALSQIIKLNQEVRNNFLKLTYSSIHYLKLRIFENWVISLPFVIFLIYQQNYLFALILLISCVFSVLFVLKNKSNFYLPTPFFKYPFEFTIGFRTNFILYIFAYFLTIMSIVVYNFNLGIFSLIVTIMGCATYFTNSETKFYIWIYSLNPKEFLYTKTKMIVLYTTILCLPILISLCIFFYNKIDIILGIQCLGYLFIYMTMLAKYSIYPEELNIRFGIVIALTIWLPPILILIIPYLYIESTKKLKEILQ
jgi:hypothetical protein